MKKYFMTAATVALFAIGFAASDEESNESQQTEQQQTEQKQETEAERQECERKEKEESNPIAKFVGTYQLYDEYDEVGQTFLIVEDGRLFQVESNGYKKYTGKIQPISSNVFELYNSESKIYGLHDVFSYRGESSAARAWEIGRNSYIIFDLSEKKMYVDKSEYENRDYTTPEYYKFTFRK